MNHSDLSFVEIFFAMFAKAIVFVQAMIANMNALVMAVDNVPRLGAKIFALLTEFTAIVIAVVAKKFGGKFASARNTKSVISFQPCDWQKSSQRDRLPLIKSEARRSMSSSEMFS